MTELCFPDDVVIEILTRIPACHLLKLRRVCRKWKDLISTQYFLNTHLFRSKECHSSMIIISPLDRDRDDGRFVFVDKWDQPAESGPIFLRGIPYFKFKDELGLNAIDHRVFLYSYDGLVVVDNKKSKINNCSYSIYNPITGETVMIKSLNDYFFVLAFFF